MDWRARLEKKLSGVLSDERIANVRARVTKAAEEASGARARAGDCETERREKQACPLAAAALSRAQALCATARWLSLRKSRQTRRVDG